MADPKPPEPPDADESTPTATDPEAVERRQFVRRMGTDAAGIAGSLFSLSRVITRSATAAGQAMINELEGLQPGSVGATGQSIPEPGATPDPIAPPAPVAELPPEAIPAAQPPAAPTLLLDADQIALLETATAAVVAVNREGHSPQLTTATVLWDGETLRFATLGWSRRTSMLRADPRIGLLVEGPGDGRFVTVTGVARIEDGRDARQAMWPLLLREAGPAGEAGAEARWLELVAIDRDRAVIVVEPEQVLSGRR